MKKNSSRNALSKKSSQAKFRTPVSARIPSDRLQTSRGNSIEPFDEPSRVKFSIQVDKRVNTSKDIAVDTEPHLLFENIADLYTDDGDLDDKYRHLLQLGKNRGAESMLGFNISLDKIRVASIQ